jgi:WD40 repeat protein
MRSVAFSPDGKMVAAGGRNGKIRIWRTEDGTMINDLSVHRQRIRDLAFSSDSRRLATCGDDRLVNVMDLTTGQSIQLPMQPCKVFTLTFVDDDRLATAGSDNLVKVWSLTRRDVIASLPGHTGTISTLVSHDGLLISGSYDTTVRIWSEENNVAGDQARPVRRVGQSGFKLD